MEDASAQRKGILLVAFGAESRLGEDALKGFTGRIRDRFPGIPVRWAFTSGTLRERLAGRARRKSDSVGKALRRMAFEHYGFVAVQPLHIVPGYEYEELLEDCAGVGGALRVAVGKPLLTEDSDMADMVRAIRTGLPEERTADDAVLFIGHGSAHPSTGLIERLGDAMHEVDANIYTAVMKGGRTLDDVLPGLKDRGYLRMWMLPLLSLVGRHMTADLAGDRPGSWKSRIELAGLRCLPVLRGIAETPALADVWSENLAEAFGKGATA